MLPEPCQVARRRSITSTTSSTTSSYLETGHIEVGENEGLLFVNSKLYVMIRAADPYTVVLDD